MLAEAESNRTEDQQLRQQIDARNELDSAAYLLERRLAELGDNAPVHEKARAEMLIADARQAVAEEAPLDRVRSLTGELAQATAALSANSAAGGADGAARGGSGAAGASGGSGTGGANDDDVIDAEFDRA
jgi:molecular chaperone DnaK